MTMQARYTILRKIADGGTAEIFLATQHGAHGFEKTVVLKRIFPAFYADPHFRNMLVDEAHIAMSLNHNNIVQVLDLGEADGQYALAMDLVDGWTLDAVLRRARALNTGLPPALALYLTAEVCRALAYAHAKTASDGTPLGIVHRDISPHNVLLSEQGEVKLTDFGIAKAHNRRESSGEAVIKGKIAYMSPEQASGAELDARSDLFSVGTMLYVTVCRRYPFDAATDLDVLLLVKRGEWVPPETAQPGLNPEIYRVLRRAMATAPGDRYQRAEDMLVDVEHVMRMAFRAVGQTELKRWLQDLSMRDGVPPLTRAPALPWTPTDGQGGREIAEFELKTVGVALPPPGFAASAGTPQGAPPPAPRPARVTPPPARPGATGKMRPPPPAQAMAVRRTTGKVVIGATAGNSEDSGPAARSGPQVSFDSTAATPPPTRVDPGNADSPLRTGQGHQPPPSTTNHEQVGGDSIPAAPVRRRSASLASIVAGGGIPVGSGEPAGGEGNGHPIPSFDNTPAALIDPHPPAAPRRSSTWVAQAVAASAQRTGIAPPPPVDHVVVPPPPTAFASPKRMEAAPLPQVPEPSPGPKPRRTAVGIGAGIAAVLLVGLSVRMCGRDATTARQASSPTAAPSTLAAKAPAPARPLVMPTAPLPTNAGAPTAVQAHARSAAATSAHPVEKPTAAVAPKPHATAENVAKDDPAAPPAGHEALPRAIDPKVVPTARTEPPKGKLAAAPSDGERKPATPMERSNAVSGTTAETTAGAPPPAPGTTRDRLAAGVANTTESKSDGEGDGDDDSKDPAPSTSTAAGVPDRVSVLLKSSPPGAQVATPHLNFGSTPVSVRFKPGHNYNLSFSREGYRPVVKRLRVTADPGQEVVAVMRRASSPKGPAGAQDTPTPPTQKAPGPQSGDGWFGRMFGR